ncbi:MAG: branched-chain amino acid transporter AzlC [Spirochaetales bacterium]|nr:branched-chain amino acid transporter AzlC [Spirochaetales bacterium]
MSKNCLGVKTKAFKAALPYTLPICVGFLFLGMSYGFLMKSKGFSFIYPTLMSLFIFAGSMEFVTVNLLLSAFNPLYAFALTLMVNARHLFYGLSMLDKYKNVGLKKLYLIFGMCDESFTINYTVTPPSDIDKGWFMFFVTLLNQLYWVSGATLGALLGYVIHFNTKGLEFVMTALFVVMFIEQWEKSTNHRPALIGVICSVLSLIVFGSSNFVVVAMALIILCFTLGKNYLSKEAKV